MKVYLQIEDAILRYLEMQGIPLKLLQELTLMVADSIENFEDFVPFWKSLPSNPLMSPYQIWELEYRDFKNLFTKSFAEGYYVGEFLESCLTEAFFRFLL